MNNKSRINRSDRLNSEFQREIYEIITRRIKNPFITEMFSIIKVDTSPDLSHAKVLISIYSKNEEKKTATFNAIKEEAGRIRYELAHSVRHIRTVPELHFFLDDSMEYSDKINKLFIKIKNGETK